MKKLGNAYKTLFFIAQYEYEGLFDPFCRKELSWKEKVFCKEGYASDEMMQALHNIEEISGKKRLAKLRRRVTEEAFLLGDHVVIKSVERKGFIKNLLSRGLAINIWNNAHWMKEKGIPVLKPIALVEKRGWNQSKSFVVYLYEGSIDKPKTQVKKKGELEQCLHKNLVVHHDLLPRNVVTLEDGGMQCIDIDEAVFYPRDGAVFRRWRKRDVCMFQERFMDRSSKTGNACMRLLTGAYKDLFFTAQYEYAKLFDDQYKKELSWGEKIFCLKEYASVEMMEGLHKIEEIRGKLGASHRNGRVTEEVFFLGNHFIIKSGEVKGFVSNLMQMGLGTTIWNNADWMKEKGIPVLKPIALVEKRGWNRTKSFVIYLYEGGLCKGNCSKISELKQVLLEKCVIHGDLLYRNIVVLEDGSVQCIDIDNAQVYPRNSIVFRWRMERDFCKLKKSGA